MLSLTGLLDNAYMGNPFINKETGEVTPASLKIQVLCEIPQKTGGIKKQFIDLSVKDTAKFAVYQGMVGKCIRIPVGAMASGKTVQYWVLSDQSPELATKHSGA